MNIFERIQLAAKMENREEVKRLTALLGAEDREEQETPDTPEETEGQDPPQETPDTPDTPDTPEEEEGEGVPEETEQEPQEEPQETEGETEDTETPQETPEGQETPQEEQETPEEDTPQEEDREEPQETLQEAPEEQDIPEGKPEPQDFEDREQEGEEPQDTAPEPQEREEETEQEQDREEEQEEETTTTTTPDTEEETTESASVSGCEDIHTGIGYQWWPLADEHKRDLQAGAREVLEIDPGIDEILEEVAEDIAETWDLLKAPSRSSRIGSAQGRLGIGSLRRVATAHPLPFHGPAIKQGFDNTEVIVLLDRSGSMWSGESLKLSNGRSVYTGSRWSVACLTIAAMQRAIELVGRTEEINLRVISWANDCQKFWGYTDRHHTNRKKGKPVTMNHGGGVSRLTAVTYRDVADVRVQKKGTGFKGQAIFIEHEPSAMACAALNLSGSRMDSVHHAGGSNDILPTMTSLMSILGPEDPGCRRFGILFSDGDIGFSKRGPSLPYSGGPLKPVPGIGRSQFQLMLDQWDSQGIPVGVVDYGAGLAEGMSNPEQVAIGADIGNMVSMMESMLR